MNVRWQSLKVRYAIISSLFIAVVLLVNALLLIYFKYREFQRDIEQRAVAFSNLAVKPICEGYDTYYYSGYFKFQELMTLIMDNDSDLTRILLLDVNGRILFDSEDLKKSHFIPQVDTPAPIMKDEYYLDAIRKLEPSQRYINSEAYGRCLEITAPYKEEWGRHKLSVIMAFSFRSLEPQIRVMVYQVTGLTLLSMLFTSFLTWLVTGKITEPLDELTEKVRGLMKGVKSEPEDETSGNEIRLLTNTFTEMTSRIQEYIRELENSNRKLAALNEELKELDKVKSDLLANVSHELRTPLTSIKGYTEYILEGKLGGVTPKQEKGLMVVQRNLDRLSKLINALLDYSLMDAERMVLAIKPFNIKLLAKQIAVNLGSELEKRGLQFEIDMADDLPLAVGDKEKLYQVLENLTINSIKFTESGGKITLSAQTFEDEGRLWIKMMVHDTGIGIPEPALQRIFDRFYQVDGTSKRKYGGMGLGLAIARSIVDAHKGRIEVESAVGKGTTFTITLPALQEADAGHDEQQIQK
ncbi:MAG TPA: HAMP domain-containing sensor histidine kinase, partial [Acidobacteriota bacterium]|nr:HAMP domain-containing sensor histidine kinase [Acidobacteriota bacterium]